MQLFKHALLVDIKLAVNLAKPENLKQAYKIANMQFQTMQAKKKIWKWPRKKKLMPYVQTLDHKVTSANRTTSKSPITRKFGSHASKIRQIKRTTLTTSAGVTTLTRKASPVYTAKSKVTTRTTADPASEITHHALPTVEKPTSQRRSTRSRTNQLSTTSPIRVFTKGFSCSPNWIP